MYPKRDSNSHDRSHRFLRPTRLPLRHRGIDHITQAFYSQLRGIVYNLARYSPLFGYLGLRVVVRTGFEPAILPTYCQYALPISHLTKLVEICAPMQDRPYISFLRVWHSTFASSSYLAPPFMDFPKS